MNNNQHRILVITELFLPTKGGTAIWFSEVFRRLGGKSTHIVTAKVPGSEIIDANHANTIHRIRLRRVWWMRPESLDMYLRLFFKTFWLAVTNKFEAIHAIRSLPEGLVAWIVARLTLKHVVIYNHGEELTTWGDGAKFKTMCFVNNHADKVVANSDYTREQLIRIGIDPVKIAVIYPGVNVNRFRPNLPFDDLRESIGVKTGEQLLLSVGRLSRRKGFDSVIRSMSKLLDEGIDVHYVLIGVGEDYEYLTGLTKELNVSGHVHLLGHVSTEDLPRWYNACDLFVMPNREINGDNEGFGMVYLEAAACGKPAISGLSGGTGSAVIEGMTGRRIDGRNVVELTDTIKELLFDPDYALRLGTQGYHRVINEFSWESVAKKTATLTNT